MSYQLYWAIIGAAGMLLLCGGAWAGVYLPAIVRKRKAAKREAREAKASRSALSGAATEAVYARSIDRIDIGSIVDTGLTTAIKRYRFTLEFWWTDDAGEKRHYGPAEHVWPNDLADVPLRIVKGWATDLITQAVRWRLGLEPYPDG